MVDLRDAFRPFVDEAATAARRPVAEVAERAAQARRRRVRRRSAMAGLAAVVVAGGLALAGSFGSPDRSGQVSVSDTQDPDDSATTAPTSAPPSSTSPPPTSTSTPSTTTSTTAPATTVTAAPQGAAPPAPLVSLVDGVVATSTTTSSWEDGYCVQVRVENTAAAPVEWKIRYAPAGTIATLWSAVADEQGSGAVVLTGEAGYNRQLAAGASTTFGACIDR